MKKIFSVIFILIAGLLSFRSVHALQITYPDWFLIEEGMQLTQIVAVLFNFLLAIAGIAAFVMIVLGGFRYLTSAGDPSKMGDARSQIFAAILGIIILFSSWMILNTINPELVSMGEPITIPISTPPKVEPPPIEDEESPVGFYYIPLGQIIDDVIIQEKESLPKMREFANLASQCGID